ncbi:MAG TPA: TIGR03619 family F420-dependent LLM class oxidoreductase [Acidimicrobiales bacterium]
MEYGTSFNGEWLADIGALRSAASELDEAGIDFVSYGGHVLTSRLGRYERPASTYAVPFRDFFVLFALLAARTTRLRFRSGILILPMFQTVLVAKQAAELSLVSDGRFELGVGISWNEPEYRAMGQELSTRGRRLEEQLVVLRQLWTEEFVTYHGQFHDIEDLGLGQLPTSPIPIWIGCGESQTSMSRVARLADGWMPIAPPSKETIDGLQAAANGAARSAPIGVTGRVLARPEDLGAALADAHALAEVGVSAISISPPPGSDVASGTAAVIATRDALAGQLSA